MWNQFTPVRSARHSGKLSCGCVRMSAIRKLGFRRCPGLLSDNGCETGFWKLARRGPRLGGSMEGNPTNPANLCPIYCGGAATYSRPRTIILHNEDGDCKSFFETWPPPC